MQDDERGNGATDVTLDGVFDLEEDGHEEIGAGIGGGMETTTSEETQEVMEDVEQAGANQEKPVRNFMSRRVVYEQMLI